MSITKCGSLSHTNSCAKLPGAHLSPIPHFQSVFPSLGVCPTFPSMFLPTVAREDTPFPVPHLQLLLCAFSPLLPSVLCQALCRDPRVVEINLMLAARFF